MPKEPRRRTLAYAALLAVLLLGQRTAGLHAQSGLGGITGQVTDASGAVIPGTSIEVLNVATNIPGATTSSSEGIYNLTSLLPGRYVLTARRQGFQEIRMENILVTAGNTTTVNVKLSVGEATTRVEVRAESPLLTSNEPVVSATIDRDLVANLPYPESSSLSATMLVAGVRGNAYSPTQVSSENPGVGLGYVVPGAEISVGGAPAGRSPILVDGSDVSQPSYPRAGINV